MHVSTTFTVNKRHGPHLRRALQGLRRSGRGSFLSPERSKQISALLADRFWTGRDRRTAAKLAQAYSVRIPRTALKKIFGTKNSRELKRMGAIVRRVNALEESVSALNDTELAADSVSL